MLTILIADSELELIPEDLHSERSVRAHASRRGKKAGELLLDSSLHHTAMVALAEKKRRGRPDMIHTTLLVILESVLNLEGRVQVMVHTRNDEFIRFNSTIRLPKNYNRFVGLMEQLFASGKVPRECADGREPLISLTRHRDLSSIVDHLKIIAKERGTGIKTVLLSESGRFVEPRTYFASAAATGEDLLCIIGGFPEGDYRSSPEKLHADDIISINTIPLKSWTVAAEIIVNFRI